MSQATLARRVKLPAQLQAVEDLLLWTDVTKSAGVLGAATLLYILLEWSGVPLLTWLSNLALIAIAGTTLWAVGARVANMEGPAAHLPGVLKTGIDENTMRAGAERLRVIINRGLAKSGGILGGQDMSAAIKCFGALWIIGAVGRIITPVGMLFTMVLGLFTLPKVYEMRKDQIDSAVSTGRDVMQKQYNTAQTKAKELYQRLTPQKGARPAASYSESKDE